MKALPVTASSKWSIPWIYHGKDHISKVTVSLKLDALFDCIVGSNSLPI